MESKKILPPTYLLLAILVMLALHFLWPLLKIIPAPWSMLGLIPLLLGIIVAVSGDRMFHRANTTIYPFTESTVLVTTGVFRFSRNPMYLGFGLILGGVATLVGTLMPFLPVIAFFFLMNELFIRTEEQMLEAKFGQTYRDYKQQVRRWI
jgi:protein-S-isoprenylcysteine O-methyltransferase Ste14